MTAPVVQLRQLAGEYVVARFPPASPVPDVILQAHPDADLFSITRTPQELSIVCPAELALADAEIDGTWSALYVGGPIPFGLTGVVTSLVAPLSAAGCPVFVLSTYDGDVLMVPSTDRDRAGDLLIAAGHALRLGAPPRRGTIVLELRSCEPREARCPTRQCVGFEIAALHPALAPQE